MNSIFYIKRFRSLFVRNLVNDRLQYLYIACGIIGLYIISAVVYIVSAADFTMLLFPAAFLLLVIAPCIFEKNADNTGIIFDYEIPASSIEKFLALWLKYVVLMPFVVISMLFLSSLFHQGVINPSSSMLKELGSNPLSTMRSYLAIQSIFMAGYLYFKNYPLVKTIAVIAAFAIFYSFLWQAVGFILMPDTLDTVSMNYTIGGSMSGVRINGNAWMNSEWGNVFRCTKTMLSIIYPIGMWLVCFLRLREREI